MRRITAVTALSVAGVLFAAGAAAALNAQVLGGPTRSSVGTADTLLPDDPFIAPTVGGTASPSDDPSTSAEPSESAKPSGTPSASATKPTKPASPSSVPRTGGSSASQRTDDKGGSSGSGSGGSGGSGSGSGKAGSDSGGSDDDKPDDD